MSYARPIVNEPLRVAVTISRPSASFTASGDPDSTTTEVGTGYADVQPISGDVASAGFGARVPSAVSTHVAFLEDRIDGVREGDVLETAGGEKYSVVFVEDWPGSAQELDLELIRA